jgi:hypothetical protein
MATVRKCASPLKNTAASDTTKTPNQCGEISATHGPNGGGKVTVAGDVDPSVHTTGPTLRTPSLDPLTLFAIATRPPKRARPTTGNRSPKRQSTRSAAYRPTEEAPLTEPMSIMDELSDRIETQRRRWWTSKASVAISFIAIGSLLLELEGVAKQDWDVRRDALGYSSQLAQQLQRIGSRLGGVDKGLSTAQLFRMPTGVDALECLARLDIEQVRRLLKRHDANQLTLAELAAAVQAVLDEDNPVPRGTPEGSSEEVDLEFGLLAARLHQLATRAAAEGRLDLFRAAVRRNVAKWTSDFHGPDGSPRE